MPESHLGEGHELIILDTPYAQLAELHTVLAEIGMDEDPLILKAIEQARATHGDKKRYDRTSLVLEQHVYPVTILVIQYCQEYEIPITPDVIAGALLHDVLEDDVVMTEAKFIELFGVGVYEIVKTLTKEFLESEMELLTRVYVAPISTQIIRLADRLNNLSCLHTIPREVVIEYMMFYILETEILYLPFAQEVSEWFYTAIDQRIKLLKRKLFPGYIGSEWI